MDDILTMPAYPVREVARLLGIHAQRARRWLMGYSYRRYDEDRVSPALRADGGGAASFLDLMELLFANQFIEGGFSLQKVRAALEEAREVTDQAHPFANRTIYVSPNDVFIAIGDRPEPELRSLLNKGQTGIRPVIVDISRKLDFGDDGYITRWYPRGKQAGVVVDPRNLGGRPRIDGTRLSTGDIVELWRASDCNVSDVASNYRISEDLVRTAIDFETAAAVA